MIDCLQTLFIAFSLISGAISVYWLFFSKCDINAAVYAFVSVAACIVCVIVTVVLSIIIWI